MRGLWALGFGFWATTAISQSPQPRAQSPQPRAQSPQPRVLLITIGQGASYWEKYGHNMLWFYDPARKIDQAYNWGTFSFDEPGLLLKILTAEAKYWVDTIPGQVVFNYYQRHDRGIVIQELNFTPDQARRAFERAQWSIRPENAYYRYDYFLDNCSTRVRDVIDYALGGALKAATQDTVEQTYRLETLRLLDDMTLTQAGVDLALAQPADRRVTRWEDMFIPMRMRDALRDVKVADSAGATKPLIAREQVMYESKAYHERTTPPVLWIAYLIAGLLLAIELFVVGQVGARSGALEKVFRFEATLWAFVTGFLGLILLVAWMATQHTFWYRNENLLLVNPLSLALAILAPLSLSRPRFARPAAIVAVLVAMLAAVALMLKGLPWLDQHTLEIIALLLPAHFAVAYHFWRRAAGGAAPAAPAAPAAM